MAKRKRQQTDGERQTQRLVKAMEKIADAMTDMAITNRQLVASIITKSEKS